MGGNEANDKAYTDGVRDGKNGDILGDMAHDAGTTLNTSEKDEIYDKGYQWGVEHRHDSDHSDSGGGGGGSDSGGGSCYLTTACIESLGLPDNCFELNTLRSFRDNVLLATTDGKKAVEEYYRIAPEIVKRINQRTDSREIWNSIFSDIKIAVDLVVKKDYNSAFEYYKQTTLKFKNKYLI